MSRFSSPIAHVDLKLEVGLAADRACVGDAQLLETSTAQITTTHGKRV